MGMLALVKRLALGLVASGSLLAQSYQTSFAEPTFDRAKTPKISHGSASVDVATGALNMDYALGPGIGGKGIFWKPTIRGAWAPNYIDWQHSPPDPGSIPTGSTKLYASSIKMNHPGMFDGQLLSLPDGTSSFISKTFIFTSEEVFLPNIGNINIKNLLNRFRKNNDARLPISPTPSSSSYGLISNKIYTTTSGHIIIPFFIENYIDIFHTYDLEEGMNHIIQIPSHVMVIKNDTAYEMKYNYHTLKMIDVYRSRWPFEYLGQTHTLDKTIYETVTIRNAFNDSINFNYSYLSGSSMLKLTATWAPQGTPSSSQIQVDFIEARTVGNETLNLNIKYFSQGGINDNFNIIYSPSDGIDGRMDSFYGDYAIGTTIIENRYNPWVTMRPQQLTDVNSGNKIEWNYSELNFKGRKGYFISKIKENGKETNFTWMQYKYKPQYNGRDILLGFSWEGYVWSTSGNYFTYEAFCWGVSRVNETDTATGHTRSTQYTRVLPREPEVENSSTWASTDFRVTILKPNGNQDVYDFVPPVPSGPGGPSSPFSDQIQTLAHLKHLPWRIRQYSPDFAGGQAPFRTVVKDRFSTRSVDNPEGVFASNARVPYPYPTRTRIYDAIKGTLETEESSAWDTTAFAYKSISKIVSSNRYEYEASDFDRLSTCYNTGNSLESNGIIFSNTQKELTSWPTKWLFAIESEALGQFRDNTGNFFSHRATGNSVNLAPRSMTYDAEQGKMTSLRIGWNNRLILDTPWSNGLLQSATLSIEGFPTGQNLSGLVGATYGHDSWGEISEINPKGTTFQHRQRRDGLGRVVEITRPSGESILFEYDTSGRITWVHPAGGEVSTQYIYHPDHLGVTIRRGAQEAELRYNGFGELVLERRFGPGGAWSHRAYGYDNSGRKTWETVWRSGRGEDTAWHMDIAPGDIVIPPWEEVTNECINGYYEMNEIGFSYWVCTEYLTIQHPAQYDNPESTHFKHDKLGRILKITNPNSEITEFSYSNSVNIRNNTTQTTTRGRKMLNGVPNSSGQLAVTVHEHDVTGRLVRITDANGGVTDYQYDEGGRLSRSQQWSGAPGASPRQERIWRYDAFGRLESTTHPETGTTTFSNFDVNGKPRTTSLNGRVIQSIYDTLGNLERVTGDQGLDQVFTWGKGPGTFAGRLISASGGGVTRTMEYHPGTGRVRKVTRSVDGHSFPVTLAYDTYGNLTSRTYPDGRVQVLAVDPSTGNVTRSDIEGTSATTYLNYHGTTWNLSSIVFANGASTSYTYDRDQSRLLSMSNNIPGRLNKTWNYGYNNHGLLGTDGEDYFTYDPLGRLTTAFVRDPEMTGTNPQNRGIRQEFEYDPFGNRVFAQAETVTNWMASNAPPAAPNKVALRAGLGHIVNLRFQAGDAAFLSNRLPARSLQGADTGAVYDDQGNLVQVFPRFGASNEAINLSYDALGRVTSASFGPLATRKTESYLYDDEGLRIRVWTGTAYRYNIYGESRQLIAQYEKPANGSLTWKKSVFYVGSREVWELGSDGKSRVTLTDHLGTPRYIWDGVNAPLQQKFLPYGESLSSASNSSAFAKGFTNHEQTDASGLIYMQARYHLPMWGRFASPDPARDQHPTNPQSWNLSAYVRNNPIMMIDPTGMVANESQKPDQGMGGGDLDETLNTPYINDVPAKTEKSQSDQKSAEPKKDVVDTLVQGLDKEGAAKEVRDPSNGSVSQAGYGKAHLGVTGVELSGGVAKTDQVGLAGPDGRLKFQAHGTEGSLALGAIPTSTTKTTGPGKTETTTTLVPKVNAQISIFKAGIGIRLGGKVYTVGLTAGGGLKLGAGKFEIGALVYFSADAIK